LRGFSGSKSKWNQLAEEADRDRGVLRYPWSVSVVYRDEFKNEFKWSSKDARGRLGMLEDES
jgi:hypothetical protein